MINISVVTYVKFTMFFFKISLSMLRPDPVSSTVSAKSPRTEPVLSSLIGRELITCV